MSAIREYFIQKSSEPDFSMFPVPDRIHLNVPLSLREPVKTLGEIVMTNDLSQLPSDLRLLPTFQEQLAYINKKYSSQKKLLFQILGILYAIKATLYLPFGLGRFIVRMVSNCHTLVFSNLNASKERLTFCGRRHKG
mmetsp:Transcript_42616/g.65358  ORF Transcript_42616/g.65358 Transcript_42616/m.65358 type:complete len:137 (-) Transcript_42616:109-519(-)